MSVISCALHIGIITALVWVSRHTAVSECLESLNRAICINTSATALVPLGILHQALLLKLLFGSSGGSLLQKNSKCSNSLERLRSCRCKRPNRPKQWLIGVSLSYQRGLGFQISLLKGILGFAPLGLLGLCGSAWPLLGPAWPLLGFAWLLLGPAWPLLGSAWPVLGSVWPLLGPAWALLGL